jgi:hypothetical protein
MSHSSSLYKLSTRAYTVFFISILTNFMLLVFGTILHFASLDRRDYKYSKLQDKLCYVRKRDPVQGSDPAMCKDPSTGQLFSLE